jgi:hypothetical protein
MVREYSLFLLVDEAHISGRQRNLFSAVMVNPWLGFL